MLSLLVINSSSLRQKEEEGLQKRRKARYHRRGEKQEAIL
jgi:hypothetical protein